MICLVGLYSLLLESDESEDDSDRVSVLLQPFLILNLKGDVFEGVRGLGLGLGYCLITVLGDFLAITFLFFCASFCLLLPLGSIVLDSWLAFELVSGLVESA